MEWTAFIAAVAGLAGAIVNLAGIEPQWGADRLLTLLANTSLPLGLLSVGAALQLDELRGHVRTLIGNSLTRLLLIPAIAFLIARAIALPPVETAILVLFCALPTAPSAYVLTRQLGGDSHLMAGLITFQTLLSAISLLLVMLTTVIGVIAILSSWSALARSQFGRLLEQNAGAS